MGLLMGLFMGLLMGLLTGLLMGLRRLAVMAVNCMKMLKPFSSGAWCTPARSRRTWKTWCADGQAHAPSLGRLGLKLVPNNFVGELSRLGGGKVI